MQTHNRGGANKEDRTPLWDAILLLSEKYEDWNNRRDTMALLG
ncbi:MAG: hypothetical protein QW310_03630 [Thermoproteota archaeon]